jgi:hypothetical protein
MLVLSLCQKYCHNKIPTNIGDKIGTDGAHGEVFEIANDPHKVIKLCVLYDYGKLPFEYNDIYWAIEYVIKNQPAAYVRTHDEGFLGDFSRETYNGTRQEFYLYYYTMDKLNKISEDEKKVFHTIISHEDRNLQKDFSPDAIDFVLGELSGWLDFDKEKVKQFCQQIVSAPIEHTDKHPRNVMSDHHNNYRLIDLDSCKLTTP